MTTPAPVNASPTFGWDTVFAVPVARVNAAIAKHKTSPQKLVYQSALPSKFEMRADFADWTIVPEGDGPIVRMALPMKNLQGSYYVKGQMFTFTCADLVGIIEIKLNVLPHDGITVLFGPDGKPLPPPKTGTTRHTLTARATSTNPADPVASFVAIDFKQPLSLSTARLSVESAFESWCNDHLADFAHVFAVVDLNDSIATGRWAFCKPHTINYAIVDKIDKSGSYLGVLCMTSNDSVPAAQQISSFAIPGRCELGFLISARRVLNDVLKPSMKGVWPNLHPDDLEVATNDKLLQLKAGKSIILPDFTTKQGDTYTPVMSSFSLEMMSDEMKVDTHTEVEVSPGIYATCTATYWYKIELGTNQKGEQTLVYRESRPAAKTSGTRHDPAIDVLKALLTIVGIVLTILLMIVDPAIGVVVGVLLAGIAVGQYEINNIQMTHKGDAPGLDDLTQNFTAPIVWSGTKDFSLQSAGLSESLQLGGV